jgi:23S rRNA (uracil1939-C5)-methyltransferase
VGRGKRKKPFIESAEITGIAAEGKAIAKYNEKIVFVPYVVPGDIVDLQVTKKRKSFMEARAVKFHKYSDVREDAFCSHYGVCGGCKWQILPYLEQLKYKQQQVVDSLTRIGKIDLPEINDILPSEETKYYRNKLEYTLSAHRWLTFEEMDQEHKDMNALGFHIPGMFDKIVDIEHCYLQPEPSNKIRLAIKQFAVDNGLSFYSQRNNEGLLRNIVIRTSTTGEVMLIVIFGEDKKAEIESLMQFLDTEFKDDITSLNYIINLKLNDSFGDLEVTNYSGLPYITEQMEELKFNIGPKSFYQTNSNQAYKLYSVVRDFASLTGQEVVYDLYTGTGTIACFLARDSKKIVGIEYVEDAIEDAKQNAEINNIKNTSFFAGDMKDVLNSGFISENGKPDVIVTDPPRAGMHTSVVDVIIKSGVPKIVYVSCNPATQARDLALLDSYYKVEKVQPVDMFPHTHHVENVVLLTRKSGT